MESREGPTVEIDNVWPDDSEPKRSDDRITDDGGGNRGVYGGICKANKSSNVLEGPSNEVAALRPAIASVVVVFPDTRITCA